MGRKIFGRGCFRAIAVFLLLLPSVALNQQLSLNEPTDDSTPLLTAEPYFSYSAARPGITYIAALDINIAPGWHINSASPEQPWLIAAELTFDSMPGVSIGNVRYPKAVSIPLMGEEMSVYDGRVRIYYDLSLTGDVSGDSVVLPIHFTYQPCNNRECRAPATVDVEMAIVPGDTGEPINADIFAGIEIAPKGTPLVETPSPEVQVPAGGESELENLLREYGVWGYFLALGLAFVTGLLLSFSPCTYPMIPITVSVFAGRDRSVGRGFILSLFYVGAMAVMYGLMGLVVSLVGGVFGAWLASPPVVIGIAAVFVVFALSMFGLYNLDLPLALRQKLGTRKTGGGVGGAIVLGIVAALVVSPCVGPFVAGILLYLATYGSPVFGFATLFVFAIGLGMLYILIGTFATAINRLPGAGEWMDQVKKFFGFVLLLMALYFLRTIISPAAASLLGGFLLLALAVFGGGLDRLTPESRFFPRLKKFISLLAMIVGFYLILSALITGGWLAPISEWGGPFGIHSESAEGPRIAWETDLEAGLARARAENMPILIDTWATWCANCRVLEKKTFGDPQIVAEASRFVTLKIQLERADSPETRAFMARFGWKHYSLPTTLLLHADGRTARVFTGVVGPEEMLAAMRELI